MEKHHSIFHEGEQRRFVPGGELLPNCFPAAGLLDGFGYVGHELEVLALDAFQGGQRFRWNQQSDATGLPRHTSDEPPSFQGEHH